MKHKTRFIYALYIIFTTKFKRVEYMNTEGKSTGDGSIRNKVPVVKQKIHGFYYGLSPQISASITVMLFVITGFIIIYGMVSKITDMVKIGFIPTPVEDKTEYITKNEIFETYRPMVNVKVITAGKEKIINTSQMTVGEVLSGMGLYPDENDELSHSADDKVTEGMNIVFRKIDEMGITVYEVIKHETETKYIQTIPAGTKEVIQEGADGLKTIVLQQVNIDGSLKSETIVSEEMTIKPVTKKVNIGLGGTYTDKNGKRYPYSYYIDVIATAYGGELFSGLTYTGKQVEVGMIAVDPDFIPLGSKVYVVGDYGDYGVCYAEDTGSKVIGKSIDIYMGNDMELMKEFGRREMRVYILK